MKVVLPLYCFPPIEYLLFLNKAEKVVICTGEHFVKQTYRSRYEIATSNGKLRLSVPISGSKNHRSVYEMELDYRENWQTIHWKSLISAYRHSPFFEHYEGSLKKMIYSGETNLVTFNLAALKFLEKGFKTNFNFTIEKEFKAVYEGYSDLRNYDFSGEMLGETPAYTQPFSDKTGFIPNLSGLDLLFCKGPGSLG